MGAGLVRVWSRRGAVAEPDLSRSPGPSSMMPAPIPIPSRPSILVLPILAAVLSCVPAAAQDAVETRCAPTREAHGFPKPAEVLDTTGLADAMAFVVDGAAGERRFWLSWDSLGQPETVRYDAAAAEGSEDHLLASLLSVRMRPQEPRVVHGPVPRRVPWTARLGVDRDWSLALAPTVECMPHLENGEELNRALRQPLSPHASPDGVVPPALRRRLILRLHVGEDGRIVEAEVRDGSGDPRLDRLLSERARAVARFTPAVVDDRPVRVWVELPLEIEVPR